MSQISWFHTLAVLCCWRVVGAEGILFSGLYNEISLHKHDVCIS